MQFRFLISLVLSKSFLSSAPLYGLTVQLLGLRPSVVPPHTSDDRDNDSQASTIIGCSVPFVNMNTCRMLRGYRELLYQVVRYPFLVFLKRRSSKDQVFIVYGSRQHCFRYSVTAVNRIPSATAKVISFVLHA